MKLSIYALFLGLIGCVSQHPVSTPKRALPLQEVQLGASYSATLPRHELGFGEFITHANRKEVYNYIEFYSAGKGRRFINDGLKRMANYEKSVMAVLEDHNLPSELLAVPLVESRYLKNARSSRGALGIWQLTKPAAKKGGISSSERSDIVKSSLAASKYIVNLYDIFEDWPLTLAAYNGGRTRVMRAIRESGSRDFFYLAKNGYLPTETARYVPKVLAVSHLINNKELVCE